MRPWIIVLSSAVLALAAAAAVIRPELAASPHAAMLPRTLALLPTLAITALAVYALCAILLTAGDLIADGFRVRQYLLRNPGHHGPAGPDWTAAFERSGFRRLMPPPAAVPPRPAPADGSAVLQGAFQLNEARREVGRLYYIGAARAQFFSAVIVLAAVAVLGAAQSYGPTPILPGPIPTAAAALAVVGLVLVALLARIAIDVAAEPLIEMISRLPAETAEAGLLRLSAQLLAKMQDVNPLRDAAPTAVTQLPDRLGAVLEQGHRALFEAIERLSTATDGLATTTRSSLEAVEAAFRATELREQTMTQNSGLDMVPINDLRDALAALTAMLNTVRETPAVEGAQVERAMASRGHEPDLALELRKLLQEIEAAP